MQFQQYIQQHLESEVTESVTHIAYPSIPSSEIIETDGIEIVIETDAGDEKETFTQNAKIKANKLYEKYIENGTTFEINISGKMRDTLTDTIGDLDELLANGAIGMRELYTIFEESVQEMLVLQTISFERFKQSEAFETVKVVLTKREKETMITNDEQI